MDAVSLGFKLSFDFFKGGGWSTKYTMASDSLKIIKYGNLSFKLLTDLEKKIQALRF